MPIFDVHPDLRASPPATSETPAEAALQIACQEAAEQERLIVAQQLHDTLCQSLSALQLLVALAEQKATRDHPGMLEELADIKKMLSKTTDETHKLVSVLRSPGGDQNEA